jgi:hypothetical protein
MAVSSNSPGPYTAGAAITTVLRRFRDKGLSVPITADVLMRAGVSDSLVPRTLQSLQILELIDESGQPTPTLLKMRSVPEADYKATLAEWIRAVYAEVFQFADPQTDDAVRVRDAFRTFLPHGQQDRMVSLFLTLCAEAGLATPEAKKSVERKPGMRKLAVLRTSPATAANPRNKKSAFHQPMVRTTADNSGAGLHPVLAALLQDIPRSGGWTKPARDKFYVIFGTLLDHYIPIVPEGAVSQDDSDE